MTGRARALIGAGVILLAANACGGGSSTPKAPTQNTAPTALAVASGALATPSREPFQVLSSTLYLEASDTLEIDGEVRNNSGQPAGQITIHLKLFDARGKALASPVSETDANRLTTPPGELAPFDFLIAKGKQLQRQIASYQLMAEGQPAGSQPVQGLAISAEKVTTSPQGDYVLRGQLTNTGTATIPAPEVLATFYDANGRVLRVARAVFSRDKFAAGEGDEFNLSFDAGASLGIARYLLVPQPGR